MIKGIHLNCSLSGTYLRGLSYVMPENPSTMDIMQHICQIDRHQPFTDKHVREIIEKVKPLYLTHELVYSDFIDLEKGLRIQLQACWE